MYSPGIRSTVGGSVSPFQNEDPLGKALADSVEQGAANAVQGVANWYQNASAHQEGIGDDLLRLMAGGVRNTTNAWKAATAEQEGIHDDILRGAAWTAGKGLQVLDAGSYYGGKLGGNIARLVGVDPRIGGALGNVGGDLLAGGIVKKALTVGKTAKQIRTLRALGVPDFQIDALSKGRYVMASGPVRTPNVLEDVYTAARASKTQTKRVGKGLTSEIARRNVAMQDATYGFVEEALEQKFRGGKPYPKGNTRPMMSDLLDDPGVKKTYSATNAPILEPGEATLGGTVLTRLTGKKVKGTQLTDWHHVFGLSDSGVPLMRHPSTLRALREGKPIPILERAKSTYNTIVGNVDENIASVIGLRQGGFRSHQIEQISELLGGRLDRQTINSLLGRSGLDFGEVTSRKKLAIAGLDLPTDAKGAFPTIKYAGKPAFKPKTMKEYQGAWKRVLADHGITDIKPSQITRMLKDPTTQILGGDHDHIHDLIRYATQTGPTRGKGNALYRLQTAMDNGDWFNMSTKEASKLYAEAQAAQVRIASNVMINRYDKVVQLFDEINEIPGLWNEISPKQRRDFFKRHISQIAVKGGLQGDIPKELALKPLTKRWTKEMTDVFGYKPNIR